MREEQFGDRLQQFRKQMRYTQKEFADILGIPQSTLSSYENKHNTPTLENLVSIASKCNVSLDWLCGVSDSLCSLSDSNDVSTVLQKILQFNKENGTVQITITNGLKKNEDDDPSL